MKIILITMTLFIFAMNSYAQGGHKATWNPEDTFSFVRIELTNPDNTPYANSKVVLKGEKPGHKVTIKTDKNGKAKAKVPTNDIYTLWCGQKEPAFRKVTVNEFPYVTYSMRGYTHRFVYFTFSYKNPKGIPIKGEKITVTSISTNQVWEDSTNAKGQAYFTLPFNPKYKVSAKYRADLVTLNVTDLGKEYKVMSAAFNGLGAQEREEMARIADSIARARDLEVMARFDSLLKAKTPEEMALFDDYIPISHDSIEWVIKLMGLKAKAYHKQLEKNDKFLEEQDKDVLAPLYRLRGRFKNKIIVTDITGSMYPYMEEVMLWHALNHVESYGQGTKYLFFNDGDGKSTEEKIIGETGGLYFAEGNFKDFKTIIKTMKKGMDNGGGGERPENDIEALLAATRKKSKVDEVFLVADNFSPVRDIELMKKLGVPIRIVLCGIEEEPAPGKEIKTSCRKYLSCSRRYSWNLANEQYLDLARATGGSVHTIKKDIFDLAKKQEGDSIVIAGKEYILKNGKFIHLPKI